MEASLDVLGLTVILKESKEPEKFEALGVYCKVGKTIDIIPGLSGKLRSNTIMHELVHATLDRLGTQFDDQLEEILCESIANAITDNFHVRRI